MRDEIAELRGYFQGLLCDFLLKLYLDLEHMICLGWYAVCVLDLSGQFALKSCLNSLNS
jgi:hypothetical protein